MGLETGTVVADLVITNPTSSDPKSVGDDHLRLLKTVLRNSFAGFAGNILVSGTDGGAADAYTLTPTTTLTAYSTKMLVEFTPNATNTGAATLNISGLGAKNIYSVAGAALSAGELVSGRYYLAAYDGTQFRLISVTKAYVDSLVSALPPGTLPSVTGKDTTWYLSPDAGGTTIQWTALPTAGLKLLATLTPTAAANVDFLTTFTSTYDNYLIMVEGVNPSADDSLRIRFAVSGSADSSAAYAETTIPTSGGTTPSTSTSLQVASNVESTGVGTSASIQIINANDAVKIKGAFASYVGPASGTAQYNTGGMWGGYVAANAISGFRLYWNSGANFTATGKVRVYGYSNT